MISEFPLLVFTVLTGVAAGGYGMAALYGAIGRRPNRSWLFSLACLVCLGLGLLGVLFHLGHPERFMNALANPTAMIAQEAYWSVPLAVLLLADAILLKMGKAQGNGLPLLGAVLCLGLMVVTSVAYYTSYGVAGWPELPTLVLFAVGDLAMGATLAMAVFSECRGRLALIVAIVLEAVLAVGLACQAAVFSGLPVGPAPFVVATLLTVAAAAVQGWFCARGKMGNAAAWMLFAVVAAAVIVARYGFYAAV